MTYSLLFRLTRIGVLLVLLVGMMSISFSTQASHIRAGDIQSKVDTTANYNPRRIFFRLTLYCSQPGGMIPDQLTAAIFFGDGSCNRNVPRTTDVLIRPGIRRYTYDFEHTYNAASTSPYVVSFIGENRNGTILNIRNPDSQSFYIATTVTIDPSLLQNRSPVLRRPALDDATIAQVFRHNPAAYDADGDSIAYQLIRSQQAGELTTVPGCAPMPTTALGYVRPNNLTPASDNGRQVAYPGPPVGIPGDTSTFQMNPITGDITWNSPGKAGEYNFAFKVKEFRRIPGGFYRLISEVIRDMQVTVRPTTNRLPNLVIPPDLCVVAGTPVVGNVTATDPNGNPIRLYANSGVLPPATFTQASPGPPTATGTFRWTPSCADIRASPTQVIFNAENQPPGLNPVPLTDIKTWNITVIGPAPQNLQVRPGPPNSRSAILSWRSYICRRPGARVLIYRRENQSGAVFGPCQTGIPASAGYTQIAVLTYTDTNDLVEYVDNGGPQGLEQGKTYCYRIYVDFPLPGRGASLASEEACIDFAGRPLVIRNVTVDQTAASNGQITVRWSKPKRIPELTEPRQFRVSRAATNSGPFTPIGSLIALNSVPNDTTYIDRDPSLDTQNRSYSYRVELLSQNLVAETATPASSVRLDGTAFQAVNVGEQNAVILRWTYTVPWDNTRSPTIIYRKDPNATAFVRIGTTTGTATGGTYRDEGTATQRLLKGQTYCYYVETNGTYNSPRLPDQLLNLSQQLCVTVRNLPCAPVLTLRRSNCDSLASRLFELPVTPVSGPVYTNSLSWTLSNTPTDCSRGIVSYDIYYSPNSEDSLRLLTSVPGTQLSYQHQNLPSEVGCYAVQAVDSSGIRSVRSNRECKEDCQLFLLPNIFTPNGDGKNDTFRPKVFTPIRRTHFMAFNRWGVKIYDSSSDPLINWTGGGSRTESGVAPSVVEGVYYYQAEVEFNNVSQTKRTYKGWLQVTR
ncbi:gliding motility-associated C-terminal domain-containing protein [Hymenobacter tibetensis]|uniref:Gliding motility-associated C-terminal domain-containing protein n=1 Tax=Hymenobacter tibetensis TaxID=497967 RepID=A0ABY4CTH3_9BACT|nr:gliding motility-associated C-terminal domain-containing protein [Hymenobacter tibetensis]UOG73563.1 gliding motility-associated C-terminal domain-containing protein [Hymenobacter tibetensis]